MPATPAKDILDAIGEDVICDRIAAGESQAEIAESAGVSTGSMTAWVSSSTERIARIREARTQSAECWMDRAAEELKAIPTDGTTADITRAKELAWHYRKMAAIRNPREYGDKLDISGKIDHEHSVTSLFNTIIPQPSLLCQDAVLIEAESSAGDK